MTPEGIPILTPEELEELRAEFPNLDPSAFAPLEQAAGFVSGDIQAEGLEFQTDAPRSRIEVAGDRRLPDQNTGDSRARQRLDNYYAAVTDAMQQPVISVRAAAEMAAARAGMPEDSLTQAAGMMAQSMADLYPDGYMSPADYLREINVQPYLLAARARGLPDEIVQSQLALIEEGAARQAQAVADQIGQKSYDPSVEPAVGLIREAVMDHAPKGRFASYGSRTASENAAVADAPFIEDANYRMAPEGAQNHRALRAAELFSAGDEGYAPGTGFSQFARGVGGTFGPMINRIRGVSDTIDRRNAEGTAFDDMREIGSTYGNLGYAANLYNAAGQGDPQDVYAPDGTAKYYAYDPTNVYGMGQSMYNTSFPMARMYNNTAPVREVALHLGNESIPDLAANLRRLRRESLAITPVVPDGFDPQQHREMGERLEGADTKMEGYLSAQYGPKFADAANYLKRSPLNAGGDQTPAERTYMSPAFSTLLSIPGESLSDPVNLGFNLAVPGIGGAVTGGVRGNMIGGLKGMATGAVRGMAGGVARSPTRMLDDTVEEMVENNVIGPTTTGFLDFFSPEKDNLLMDGWAVEGKEGMRQGTPMDEGHDEEVERRHLDARQAQYETADAYGKARKKAKDETSDRRLPRPVAEVRY